MVTNSVAYAGPKCSSATQKNELGRTARRERRNMANLERIYFFVLNTSKYGTAERPFVSLKFPNLSLLTQRAYVFPGSSLTGSTQVRLSARYFGLPSSFGKLSFE